jgi:hypothetical protein
MKTLPNGVTIFNSTPHPLTFWSPDWPEPVTVEPDEVINARPVEQVVERRNGVTLVRTAFEANEAGEAVIERALAAGADVIVGSLIAAQAYPGRVVAMTPVPGYERVPTNEKRMNPDKFTVF